MDAKTVLFAVGTSLLIASAFVPASVATSGDAAPSESVICVRVNPDDPSVGVHQKCDHQGDVETSNDERSGEELEDVLPLG